MSTKAKPAEPPRAAREYWSGLDLLWGVGEASAPRAGRAALSVQRIVTAAVRLADQEGLEGLSMRRIADELGTGAMSLYRHVPNKDALVMLMQDHVLSNDPPRQLARKTLTWREKLRLMAKLTWQTSMEHPWFPEATMARPPITPRGIAGLEWGLSIFDDYELAVDTKMTFVGSVHFGALSAALNTISETRGLRRAGLTAEQAQWAGAEIVQRIIGSGDFPRVSDFVVNGEHRSPESEMLASIELVLDGIGVQLAAAKPANRSTPKARSRTTPPTKAQPKKAQPKKTQPKKTQPKKTQPKKTSASA